MRFDIATQVLAKHLLKYDNILYCAEGAHMVADNNASCDSSSLKKLLT